MRRYNLEVGGTQYVIDVDEITADRYRVLVGDQEHEVRLTGDEDLAEAQITPQIAPVRPGTTPAVASARPVASAPSPPRSAAGSAVPVPSRSGGAPAIPGGLTAPMPGKILDVGVVQGARVSRGDVLLTLEAMKMKNAIKAPYDGTVMEVLVREGQTVGFGDQLMRLEQV